MSHLQSICLIKEVLEIHNSNWGHRPSESATSFLENRSKNEMLFDPPPTKFLSSNSLAEKYYKRKNLPKKNFETQQTQPKNYTFRFFGQSMFEPTFEGEKTIPFTLIVKKSRTD